MSKPENVVMALDIGATFSKVAYHTPCQGVVVCWKRATSTVPSQLYIGPGGATRVNPPNPRSGEWQMVDIFKFFLLHHQDWPRHARTSLLIRTALGRLLGCPLDADKVMSEYITILWRDASATVAASLGRESLWGLNVRVVITVPAQWPEDAVGRMARAVSGSAIPGTSMLMEPPIWMTEPEAAMAASIGDMDGIGNGPKLPEKDDLVTICDCGGLTVDVATYEVTDKDAGGYSLEQIGLAASGICGGLFLDDAFLAVMKNKIGAIFSNASPTEVASRDFLNETLDWWRTRVRHVAGPLDESQEFDVPYIRLVGQGIEPSHPGVSGCVVSLTGGEILSIFRPVVEQIASLVRRQVATARDLREGARMYLILTGGLGTNRLVQHILTEMFKDQMTVLFWRDKRPSTAVARGAALHHGKLFNEAVAHSEADA